MNNPIVLTEESSIPTNAVMSAWDVISWIAFRRVQKQGDFADDVDFTLRWGYSNPTPVLEALEGRSAEHPYCTWCPVVVDGEPWGDGGRAWNSLVSRQGPFVLRKIRARARQRTGRLLSYADLAKMLRGEMEAIASHNIAVKQATVEFLEALRASRLKLWAKRDTNRGDNNPTALFEEVPASTFLDENVTVTEWGTVTADPEKPMAQFHYRGPKFKEARCYTAEVLSIWLVSDKSSVSEEPVGSCVPKMRPLGSLLGKQDHATFDWRATMSCTITDALGRIAYGNQYDGRYYAAPGDHHAEAETRNRRKSDIFLPSTSALPGISALYELPAGDWDGAIKAWEQADDLRWIGAREALSVALTSGRISAFDRSGSAVSVEFWLANNLRSSAAQSFRFRANDLTMAGLVDGPQPDFGLAKEGRQNAFKNLPPAVRNDPKAYIAIEEMCKFADSRLRQYNTPPKRDDTAREGAKKAGITVRRARELHRYLPEALRHLPRARPS